MLASILIFAIFVPIAFLPSILENLSSAGELTQMGVRFEEYHR